MLKWLLLVCISAVVLSGCASLPIDPANPALLVQPVAERVADQPSADACAVTQPFQDEPPRDPNADPFGFGNWHINADRTIWVGMPPDGSWGTGGEKVLWIRPAGTELKVNGQRLDSEAAPLQADIPCCYPTGFQVSGLTFPSEGCWEVTATAGEHELRFITWVEDEPGGMEPTSPLASAVLLESCGNTCELRAVDPLTGATIDGFTPVSLGRYASVGVSDDHSQLATVVYLNNDYLRNGLLKFVDLGTWEMVETELTFNEVFEAPVYSPDNAYLAIMGYDEPWPAGKYVALVDVASGELVAKRALDFMPAKMRFTPDGSGIMLFGTDSGENTMITNATTQVVLLDAANLETIWQQAVDDLINGNTMEVVSDDPHEGIWWQPAAVFAPDKATLYVVHADQDQLTTVDFSAQQVTTRPISEKLSWIEQLLMLTARTAHAKMLNGTTKEAALSPDGTMLYVTGYTFSYEEEKFSEESLGLQVIDMATSQEVAFIETEARSVVVEPNGERIFLRGMRQEPTKNYATEWTEVLDAATYQQLAVLEDKAVRLGYRLDGEPILLSSVVLDNGQTELSTMELGSLAVISASADWHSGYVGWIIPN
jgi:hypothetical protein